MDGRDSWASIARQEHSAYACVCSFEGGLASSDSRVSSCLPLIGCPSKGGRTRYFETERSRAHHRVGCPKYSTSLRRIHGKDHEPYHLNRGWLESQGRLSYLRAAASSQAAWVQGKDQGCAKPSLTALVAPNFRRSCPRRLPLLHPWLTTFCQLAGNSHARRVLVTSSFEHRCWTMVDEDGSPDAGHVREVVGNFTTPVLGIVGVRTPCPHALLYPLVLSSQVHRCSGCFHCLEPTLLRHPIYQQLCKRCRIPLLCAGVHLRPGMPSGSSSREMGHQFSHRSKFLIVLAHAYALLYISRDHYSTPRSTVRSF